MQHLMADLYRAFNPAAEIRSQAWVFDLSSHCGELSQEELIAQGSLTRHQLQFHLPDLMYRILKLYYKEPYDMESAIIDIQAIRPVLLKEAKLYGSINDQFLHLCCLSEFWQINLFASDKFGPLTKYANESSYELMRRRRCRIRDCLETMRVSAVNQAEKVLYGEYKTVMESS